MTRVFEGQYAEKDHRGDGSVALQNDDETVSRQLRRPSGDLGNKGRARTKKASITSKCVCERKPTSTVTLPLASDRLVLVTELPRFPLNKTKASRYVASTNLGPVKIARRNTAVLTVTSSQQKQKQQCPGNTRSLYHVVMPVEVLCL